MVLFFIKYHQWDLMYNYYKWFKEKLTKNNFKFLWHIDELKRRTVTNMILKYLKIKMLLNKATCSLMWDITQRLPWSYQNQVNNSPKPNRFDLKLKNKYKCTLGSINMNKARGGDGIQVELFQTLKEDAIKVLHSIWQQIWKTQ